MENPSYRSSFDLETQQTAKSKINNSEPNTNSNEDDDLKCEEFDQILELVGTKGKYQKLLLYFIVCPVTFLQAFILLNPIFLLFQPDHWCHIPGKNISTDLETRKQLYIPLDPKRQLGYDGKTRYSQCTMFNSNGSIVKCESGWDYDQTYYKSTIPTAFDWVCDKASYPTTAFTIQALGNAVGTLTFGSLADKWGRKPVFFLTIFIIVLARLISFFVAEHQWAFLCMQFLAGTAFPVMFIIPTMILVEISDKDFRGYIYSCTWVVFVIGMAVLPFIVWICSEWYITAACTTLPGCVIFLYYFTMPESPRQLLAIGRLKESAKILMEIAECNGRSDKITKSQLDKCLQHLHSKRDANVGSVGMWTLFSRFRLGKNTFLLTICWSINVVVYYGITLNSTHMSGNQFLNFFLLAIIEIPAGFACGFLVSKIGRRWIQVFFFCFCGITSVATAFVVNYSDQPLLEILFVMIAKFAVTVTYLIVYMLGAEIFPTALRSTGSGFASTVSGALGMLSPLIVSLGAYNQSYPYWLISSLCVLGMICASFIPETLNQNLPETIEDANNFGKNHTFWSLYPNSLTKIECEGLPDNLRNSGRSISNLEMKRIE